MCLLIDDVYQHPQKKLERGKEKKKDEILRHLCFEETTLKQGGISACIPVLINADKTFNY